MMADQTNTGLGVLGACVSVGGLLFGISRGNRAETKESLKSLHARVDKVEDRVGKAELAAAVSGAKLDTVTTEMHRMSDMMAEIARGQEEMIKLLTDQQSCRHCPDSARS